MRRAALGIQTTRPPSGKEGRHYGDGEQQERHPRKDGGVMRRHVIKHHKVSGPRSASALRMASSRVRRLTESGVKP